MNAKERGAARKTQHVALTLLYMSGWGFAVRMGAMNDPACSSRPVVVTLPKPAGSRTPFERGATGPACAEHSFGAGGEFDLIRVNAEGLDIIDKFRGELSREVFVMTLLRIIDTDAMRDLPTWSR